jgi:hypothetical protein
MKKFCEKHHLTYGGSCCPICDAERISAFRVPKTKMNNIIGQASRESYYEEYRPRTNNNNEYTNLNKHQIISDNDMINMLTSKFGNVLITTK